MAAAILACGGCAGAGTNPDLSRSIDRNVLLITVDTLRADALSADGGRARTPAIDVLAAAGLHFSFAHAHAVVTLPSHASILTGRYPFEHGYRENSGYRLKPGIETLAARLGAAGFATGAFVGAFPLDARFGLTAGFDVYDGRFDDAGTGAQFFIPERPAPAVVSAAINWIGTQRGRWFAWVHVYEPHAPYRPPPPFDREYASQSYFGEVAAVDAALSPLLDAARRGSRPTLTILTGDHGEALGDHGEETHGLFAYESTLRVPLIISELRASGGVSPSPRERPGALDTPVRHIDVVPTILDTLGLPVAADLPGHSLRTVADRAGGSDRASYFEAMSGALEYGWAPLDGVLVGRRKYINLPIRELYDLSADAAEQLNRAGIDAEPARAMAARLAQFNAAPLAAPAAESADAAARLRALGYTAASGQSKKPAGDDDDPKRLVTLDTMMHQAAVLDDQGRLADAVAVYKQILARRPQMTAAARHLAFDEWRLGLHAAAIDTLRRAIDANGPVSGLPVQLGAYLIESGRTDRAVDVLQRAAQADPTFDVLHALGLAHARGGRHREAQTAFARARAIDPKSAIILESIGADHLDAGRFAESRSAFEDAIRLHADRSGAGISQAYAGAATAAARAGDSTAAIDHWSHAVAADPSNLDALYDLGVQLARLGRRAEARPYLEQFARTAQPQQYAREIVNVNAILKSLRGQP